MSSFIRYLTGDAARPENPRSVIAHVANDQQRWGAGFTGALEGRFGRGPRDTYMGSFRGDGTTLHPPGFNTYWQSSESAPTWVANMVSQHGLGTEGRRVRYDWLAECLTDLWRDNIHLWEEGYEVVMPRIGCGLAGGDWAVVGPLIEDCLLSRDIPVTVYDLP